MSAGFHGKVVIGARALVAACVMTAVAAPRAATAAGCGNAPRAFCVRSGSSALSIKESAAGRERLDVSFKTLMLEVAREDFGDPVTGTTRFDVCIYDAASTLVGALTVDRGGQMCGLVGKPCWQLSGADGYRYRDSDATANGVRSFLAQGGTAGRGQILIKAGNNFGKQQLTMPTGIAKRLEGSGRAVAQVLTNDGRCFTTELSRVLHTDSTRFRARGAAASTAPPTTVIGSSTTSTTRASTSTTRTPTTTRPTTTSTRATTSTTRVTTSTTNTTLPGGSGQLQWAEGLGSSWEDLANAVVRDGGGNILVTGTFMGSVSFGGGALTSNGSVDAFVAKYTTTGVHQWSRSFGGVGTGDAGNGIAVDGSGNVFVVGSFAGTANVGGGAITSAGVEDIVLVKYSATGAYMWSRRIGSTGSDVGRAVAVDHAGNVVVTGNVQGTVDFGGGPLTVTTGAFIAKYSPTGTHIWSRVASGSSMGRGIAVDAGGNVVVVGKFGGSADFGGGVLPGSFQIFVVKYSPTGAHQWSKSLGGSGVDVGEGVAIDRGGNVVVIGEFDGSGNFGTGTLTSAGGRDVVIVRLSAAGSPVWTKRAGGAGHEDGRAIAVDASDNVIVTGSFSSASAFGGSTFTPAGQSDIFIAKYAVNGGHVWSHRVGGWDPDTGRGVAVDTAGGISLVGGFGYNLVNDSGAQTLFSAGQTDVLVTKFTP